MEMRLRRSPLSLFFFFLYLVICRKSLAEMVAKCPPHYIQRGGTSDCYLFHSWSKRTWEDASTYCETERGNLVRIGTSDMPDWLSLQIAETGLSGDASNFWIDARYNETTEQWYWASSGGLVDTEEVIPLDPVQEGNYGTLTLDTTLMGKPGTEEYHFICHRFINEPMYCDYEEGWYMNNDRCYSSPSKSTSFTNAEIECEQMSGKLITINDAQEQGYAYDQAHRHYDNVWIGMNEITHPGHFYWIGDNTSTYTHWNETGGMPVSQGGYGAGVIDREDATGQWLTEVATNDRHYICENSRGACVMGWELFQDSCYYFNNLETDKVTWDTAYELCNNISAHLVIVESAAEDEFIRERFSEQDNMWMGLYVNTSEKIFMWVDGEPYNPDNFTQMTPDDMNAALATEQRRCNYMHMQEPGQETEKMNWMPVDCGEIHKYICEVPKDEEIYIHVPPLDQYCPEEPAEWKLENDFCYYGFSEELSWTAAESACKEYGGHLASINTWREQDLVREIIEGDSWFGLNNRDEVTQYVFSDGNRLSIQNWASGEPTGGTESCIEIKYENGEWNDLECSKLRPYVCRRSYSTSPLGPPSPTTEGPDSGDCGEGWVEDVESATCYRVEERRLNYADAQLHCNDLHYYEGESKPQLVSLSTYEEQSFVAGLLLAAQLEDFAVYIGMRNEYDGLYWLDGSPVTFLNFADSEPNSAYYETCIEMYNDGLFKWNDIYCDERIPFVCEKKSRSYVQPTVPTHPSAICPDGWVNFNQHCYFFSLSDTVGWQGAKESCESMYGSTLASVTSADENNFILEVIYPTYSDVWLGLYASGANDSFEWIDGSPLEYTNWYPGEPNNQDGNEPCGEMMWQYWDGTNPGTWNDIHCEDFNGFVCKTVYKTCPQSWELWEGKCYYISDNAQTWDISLEKCKEVEGNASLLSWHSQEEVDHVTDLIGGTIEELWVGLYKDVGSNSSSGDWLWTDGSDTDYLNWASGQPQNGTEYCGADVYGKLHDYPCDKSFNYACEYQPSHYLGCDEGFQMYNNWCYYTSYFEGEGATNWYSYADSKSRCESMGGMLASVHSREENEFLGSLVADAPYREGWIGLTQTDQNGKFEWLDGSDVTYTNFDMIYNPEITSCFNLNDLYNEGNYKWTDTYCSYMAFFFCSKAPSMMSTGPSPNGCLSNDDLAHGVSCYRKMTTPQSFTTARSNCSSLTDGADLVTMQTASENAFLSAYYFEIGDKSWIGLQQISSADGSTTFKWIDGSDFTFDNWGQFEPNVNGGGCVYASGVSGEAGLWYVSPCDQEYPFYCEYPREGYTTQAPPTTTPRPSYCAPGWDENSGTQSCYKLMMNKLPQGLAESDCVQYGGHLVSITSELEQQFILGISDLRNQSKFWTGLVAGEVQGYEWLDGSPTSYLNWADGQPDTHLQRENCVTATNDTLEISDTYCDSYHAYMCKAPQGMSGSTAPPVTSTPDVPCPGALGSEGWLLFNTNDHCYRVYSSVETEARPWMDARSFCHSKGSELASILNEEENRFIVSKIYDTSDNRLWLGGNADYDRSFHWSDGSPWEFVNWRVGEPNNYHDQESCVSTYPGAEGYWNDDNCGVSLGFICKKPASATVAPPDTTPTPTGHCPHGWLHVQNHCVHVVEELMTFEDAREACKGSGVNADLASIHGPVEQAELTAALGLVKTSVWIGFRWNQGFYWVDESTVDYTNWGPGEPNNYDGAQECGLMLHYDGTWDDVGCEQNRSSLCMMGVSPDAGTHYPMPTCKAPYESYVNYSGSCFRAVQDPKSWQDAVTFCQNENADLVPIESIIENSFIYSFAVEQGMDTVWTGLNSLDDIDKFKWVNNYPVLYTNWGAEPNVSDTNARCVELSVADVGTWFTRPCNEQKSFFCRHYEGTIPTPDPPSDGKCPDSSWLDFGGGYCYLNKQNDVLDWNNANRACLQSGGFLVSIHSQQEMDYINKATTTYAYELWSGLVYSSYDEVYKWADGSAYDFQYWEEGEPNGAGEEGCVQLNSDGRKWNDISCDVGRGYLCKAKKVDETPNTSPAPPVELTSEPINPSKSGLSGGGIAGIVIACLVLVAAVGAVAYSKRESIPSMSFPSMSFPSMGAGSRQKSGSVNSNNFHQETGSTSNLASSMMADDGKKTVKSVSVVDLEGANDFDV